MFESVPGSVEAALLVIKPEFLIQAAVTLDKGEQVVASITDPETAICHS